MLRWIITVKIRQSITERIVEQLWIQILRFISINTIIWEWKIIASTAVVS